MASERILLHICCAPCATTVIRRLQDAGFAVHGFFYNPNIQPEKEYYLRLMEVQRLCKLWSIPLEIGDHDWDRWQAGIHGQEDEKEGGERCRVCFRYRLAAAAQKARELEIGTIATTLTISPRKPPEVVNPIGKEVTEELELMKFYEADWKKKDGFKQSLEISRELNIYRQNYCGCKYSLKEREERERTNAEQRTLNSERRTTGPGTRNQEPGTTGTADQRGQTQTGDFTAVSGERQVVDTRAKWELSPLERKQRRDKKAKPWQQGRK